MIKLDEEVGDGEGCSSDTVESPTYVDIGKMEPPDLSDKSTKLSVPFLDT